MGSARSVLLLKIETFPLLLTQPWLHQVRYPVMACANSNTGNNGTVITGIGTFPVLAVPEPVLAEPLPVLAKFYSRPKPELCQYR